MNKNVDRKKRQRKAKEVTALKENDLKKGRIGGKKN